MIIYHNIIPFITLDTESVRSAICKIDSNEEGIIFCVQDNGLLLGVLTDGDFRRWVLSQNHPDLDQSVSKIINRQFVSAQLGESMERISALSMRHIKFIPLLDSRGRFVALAGPRKDHMIIGASKIGIGQPCFIIAEIGNNHNGSPDLARSLVDEAIGAGADCVKFQLRDLHELYINHGRACDAREDLGSQYILNLLNRFQLKKDQLFEIFDYCVQNGTIPLCTPWDIPSLETLKSYGMQAYKSASADLTNHDLLESMVGAGKPLICSTGMSSDLEIGQAINLLRSLGAQFVLLHCNSTYPTPMKDINLRYMAKLRSMGECPVGYSSHDLGFYAPLAAVTLGANIIEKHFTLDQSMEGNDHRVSLIPPEFAEMVKAIRQVEMAMGEAQTRLMSQGEIINRESLAKSLYVNCRLKPGQVIEGQMLQVKSPGRGLSPNRKREIVGKVIKRTLEPGDVLYLSDLEGEAPEPRPYKFNRSFGIPIRFHDLNILGHKSNFDLLEFHLSFEDMEQDLAKFLKSRWTNNLVVHAPELFARDHIMDLCSPDAKYRSRSIFELNRVADMTRRLSKWFALSQKTRIIINAGGFSESRPFPIESRALLYELIADALQQVDLDDVEVIPQTMPPFPWHFGGQRFHNLFVDPDEIRSFCDTYSYRVCLDTSHSKLACNCNKLSFREFIEKIGPVSAHLHIADASGFDGEGLQIGQGEIDIKAMCKDLNSHAKGVSFIPEIWQGHKNSGEGFWRALSELEGLL